MQGADKQSKVVLFGVGTTNHSPERVVFILRRVVGTVCSRTLLRALAEKKDDITNSYFRALDALSLLVEVGGQRK